MLGPVDCLESGFCFVAAIHFGRLLPYFDTDQMYFEPLISYVLRSIHGLVGKAVLISVVRFKVDSNYIVLVYLVDLQSAH